MRKKAPGVNPFALNLIPPPQPPPQCRSPYADLGPIDADESKFRVPKSCRHICHNQRFDWRHKGAYVVTRADFCEERLLEDRYMEIDRLGSGIDPSLR